jgi:uncharacterized membrane protein YfcA
MSAPVVELIAITLFAAVVNGGLGYGFSSITVPLALLFLTNRALNPALVLIEVVLNAWVLWVNRDALGAIWKRMLPIVIGLVPGVIVGTMIVTSIGSSWLKLWTYLLLLPLILFQAAGFRRPIKSEKAIGVPFGLGLGVLYSMTTISGPPLAVLLNNQGLKQREFRASLGFIRLAESSFTAVAYLSAHLITRQSNLLIPQILPSVLIGVPIGAALVRQMKVDTFRRICMSFDAWIVGFGASTVMRDTKLLPGAWAYLFLLGVILIDGVLLYRFFSTHGGRVDLARTT